MSSLLPLILSTCIREYPLCAYSASASVSVLSECVTTRRSFILLPGVNVDVDSGLGLDTLTRTSLCNWCDLAAASYGIVKATLAVRNKGRDLKWT